MVEGGRVIIRSKPFIASELWEEGWRPPEAVEIYHRGRCNELRGFNPPTPSPPAIRALESHYSSD